MTPTINVNLKPCDCGISALNAKKLPNEPVLPHAMHCAAFPVLIPCPIPRTVTFEVRMGECGWSKGTEPSYIHHSSRCPARPVRVSCSISGETWEASEVASVGGDWASGEAFLNVRHICVDRWALVKALVLGRPWAGCVGGYRQIPIKLFEQRDAVFAALCDMARAERATHAAFLALPMEIRESSILAKAVGHVATDPTEARWPSATILEHYVACIFKQVSALQ